jgi:hypothetical protein
MRRRELEKLIEKRPALWGRFSGYLTSGHVFVDDLPAGARHHSTMKSPAQLQREIDEVLAAPKSFSYEEAMTALEKKHAGVKRGGSLRAGHASVVPKMSAWTTRVFNTRHAAQGFLNRIKNRHVGVIEAHGASQWRVAYLPEGDGMPLNKRHHSTVANRQMISPDQLAALRTFADANGRSWKSKLNAAWSTGRYADYNGADEYGSLQQIRNTFGPAWLVKFDFDKPKTHGVKV